MVVLQLGMNTFQVVCHLMCLKPPVANFVRKVARTA